MAVVTLEAPTQRAPRDLRAPACRHCLECVVEDGLRKCGLTGSRIDGADGGPGGTFCIVAPPSGDRGKAHYKRALAMVEARGKTWRLRLYETGELRVRG